MAIKIPFIADVVDFLRGTSDMEQGLEEVSDALDDLARNDSTGQIEDDLEAVGKAAKSAAKDAETAGEKIESSMDEAGKSADASAERIERSFKESFKAVESAGGTVKQKLKSDLDGVGGKGGAFSEFRDEAKQNLAESVSSFQGNASSAVDAVQSTFGGLISALGPAGVVGAAVAGVGIGLARGLFEKSKEAAQDVAEAVADLAGQFIELGKTDLGAKEINDKLREFAETAEDGSVRLDKLAETADKAGINFRNYARGVAGDNDAIKSSYDEVNTALAENQEALLAALKRDPRGLQESTQALKDEQAALKDARAELIKQDGTLDQAATTAGRYKEATEGSTDATKDSAEAIADENDKLTENARLKGTAVESEWDMKDALDGITASRKENGKSLSDNTAKGRENQRAIKDAVDAINDYGDAQIEAGKSTTDTNKKLDSQEDALVNKVSKAFGISKEAARTYIETLGGIPKRKDTDVKVTDNGTAAATKREINDIPTSKEVKVTVDASGVQSDIQRIVGGKTYYFDVAPRPGKPVGG